MSFTDAIKSHLLQWFHEKNRKIEDGYDYEVLWYLLQFYIEPFNYLKIYNYCIYIFELLTETRSEQTRHQNVVSCGIYITCDVPVILQFVVCSIILFRCMGMLIVDIWSISNLL